MHRSGHTVRIIQWVRGLRIWRWRTLSTGAWGERRAEDFLKKKRFRILARNWRNPQDRRDELDLVCRDGEVLVFVEVKTRSTVALVSGYYAIDRRKKKVLRRTADAYLKCLPPAQRPRTFRFDVVEVDAGEPGSEADASVRHFENVPLFEKFYAP